MSAPNADMYAAVRPVAGGLMAPTVN